MDAQVAISLAAASASSPADDAQLAQLPASPTMRTPPNTPYREYGIRTLRKCAETSVREYVRLLELRRAKGLPGEGMVVAKGLEDADDHLDERIGVQADIALDDLRALESKVSNIFELSQRHQLRRWFQAGSLALLMPLIHAVLLQFFPHLPAVVRYRASPSWPETILSSVKYVTRNLYSTLMSLCVKLFGTTGWCAWQSLDLVPQNETQPDPNDNSNSSSNFALKPTSNATAADLADHTANSTFAPFSGLSTYWATFVTFLFGNTTNTSTTNSSTTNSSTTNSSTANSSADLSSGQSLDIESPLLPPLVQNWASNSLIHRIADSLQTYSTQISTTLQLLAVLYLVGGEMHHRAAKTMSERLRVVYTKVEKKGQDEEDELSREDALKALGGWQWDMLLWGQ